MLEEAGHILPAVEPDRPRVPTRPKALREAGRLDEIEDVAQVVREAVAEVFVAPGPVDEDAAVGADATAQEGPRCRGDDGALPVLERDAAVVLLPRSVLREEAGQVGALDVQNDLGAVVENHTPDRILGEAAAEQGIGLAHDRRILQVEADPQPLRPSRLTDVAVPQVEPEQLGVVIVRELEPPNAAPAPRAATNASAARRISGPYTNTCSHANRRSQVDSALRSR